MRPNWTNRGASLLPSFPSFKFLGKSRIAKAVLAEVHNMKPQAVLHLALPKILQVRLPIPASSQILRQTLAHKSVPGVPEIHDPLRHITPRPRTVRLSFD